MDTKRFTSAPKTHVRFLGTVKVEGAEYKGGAVIDRKAIPAGCLESLVRMRHAEECDAPAAPPEPKPPAPVMATEPKKPAPKAGKPEAKPAAKPEPPKENK